MNEIKFKYVFKHKETGNLVLKIFDIGQIENALSNDDWRQYQLIDRLQYTGKKDKNSKEIFESDILKYFGIVFWDGDNFQWGFIDIEWNNKKEKHNFDYLTCEYEIIGNKYENPELLK